LSANRSTPNDMSRQNGGNATGYGEQTVYSREKFQKLAEQIH